MAQQWQAQDRGWAEAIGLPHLLRMLGLAVQPGKLAVALLALVLTLGWGGLLDLIWTQGGGIGDTAIHEFMSARLIDVAYQEPEGDSGIFEVWRRHVQDRVVMFFSAVIPPDLSVSTAWQSLTGVFTGTWWLIRAHFFFFLLLAAGLLLIWSAAGGTICRMSALELARDERPGVKETLEFTRTHLFGGYFLAPCVPLAFMAVTALLMILGGMVLRIPILGDLLCGLAFCLAIFGGTVVAVLLVGLVIGGNLFWPTVAAEGSDAFDAFSRGLSYSLSKPWKTLVYGVVAIVLAAVCWLIARLLAYLALVVTWALVAVGTSWFGWWERSVGEETSVAKLALLWPKPTPAALYAGPNWEALAWPEYFSAVMIGIYVLLVIGLVWAFLCTLYFSGCTVAYFLLRRDIDAIDLEEVYVEEAPEPEPAAAPPPAEKPAPAPSEPEAETKSSGEASGPAPAPQDKPESQE